MDVAGLASGWVAGRLVSWLARRTAEHLL